MEQTITDISPFILLAEDDEDDKEFISLAFKKVTSKHRLHIADNGQQAIEFLLNVDDEKGLPCLIVLDLNMPVMDGVQTLEALNQKTKFKNIPKVIFTTSDSEIDKARCLSNGATDYLVKPANMTGIMKSVETMLQYCD